jgi:hypothetical protein
MGIEQRRFARVRPSGLVSGSASVFGDQKGAPTISCRLIDISTGGACLEIAKDDVQVPARLTVLHGGVRKRARLVWKRGRRFGVAF